MKSLKTALIRIFSIALLATITSIVLTEIESDKKTQGDVLVSLSIDKNKLQVPTNG